MSAIGTTGVDRRTFLKASGFTLGGAGLASLLAACGGGQASSSNGTLTLRLPFLADMQVPDPDIMYEGEGVQVMESCYDGLVNYKPGTNTIVPGLAQSWTLSPDQLTYTFTLVPNVKFHDGTIADATSWLKSFERRRKVKQGPAYMVAGIAKAEAPNPTTLVVTLKTANNAFLHYLACPWQPFAVSPTAVAKYATNGDLAQSWLKTHDAGTGPYVMKEFVAGSHYTLEAFPDYWGEKPAFETVQITITPSLTTQKLQLDQGAYDIVTKGFAIPDVVNYMKNPSFKVTNAFGGATQALWLNPTSGVFTDKSLRKAMATALNRKSIVQAAYSGISQMQKGVWPEAMFPPAIAPFPDVYDTAPLKALAPTLASKQLTLAWSTDGGAPTQQMAELVQTQLATFGLKVSVIAIPTSQLFDLVNQPASKRPDLLFAGIGGDALHVDTGLRILLRTGAKPLNFFAYSNPTLDRLMDKAVKQPTVDQMNAVYKQATELIIDEAVWIPFCAQPFSVIAHKDIGGIELNSYYPEIFKPSAIKKV
jgi:peptide/nickel transport system substrate-binding protein